MSSFPSSASPEPSELRFARAYLEGGMAKEAEDQLRRLLARDPQQPVWRLLGDSLSKQARWSEALDAYRTAHEADPGNVQATDAYAQALAKQRRFTEAAPLLEKIAAALPTEAAAQCNAGLVLQEIGDTDRALTYYETALGIDSDLAPALAKRNSVLAARHRPHFRWRYFPAYITLDNHRACNARCRMCPTQNIPLDMGRMDDELFETLLDQLRCFRQRIKRVQFGVHGEPLLDRSLEERVARLVEFGISVGVVTNGSALTAKRARRLVEAGVSYVILALDGITAETFENIRIGLKYETVLRNTLELIRVRDELGARCQIMIRLIEQQMNRHEIPDWLDFWNPKLDPRRDTCRVVPMHNWTETIAGAAAIDYGNTPCGSTVAEIVISANGDVPLCCVDYDHAYHFGRIQDAHLLDIFNQPSFAALRAQHIAGERQTVALCGTCSLPERNIVQTHAWDGKLVWNDAANGERRQPSHRIAVKA